MTTSVLDASVAFKWVVLEPGSPQADLLRDEAGVGLRTFLAPDTFPIEVAHALTKAERRRGVVDADRRWLEVMRICPQLCLTLPLLPRAIEIARQTSASVYDCLYVALAKREGCDLITADDRLIRNLGDAFPFVVALVP